MKIAVISLIIIAACSWFYFFVQPKSIKTSRINEFNSSEVIFDNKTRHKLYGINIVDIDKFNILMNKAKDRCHVFTAPKVDGAIVYLWGCDDDLFKPFKSNMSNFKTGFLNVQSGPNPFSLEKGLALNLNVLLVSKDIAEFKEGLSFDDFSS